MSEFNIVECQFKDKSCLIQSIKEIGYESEFFEEPVNLRGYMNDQRAQKANILIKKEKIGSASNDIGFLKNSKGQYDLIISEYDVGRPHGSLFTEKLKQIYTKNVTLKSIASQLAKYNLSKPNVTTDDQGRIKIKLTDFGA